MRFFKGWKDKTGVSYSNDERHKCYVYARSKLDSVMLINAMLHDAVEGDERSEELDSLQIRLLADFAKLNGGDKKAAEASAAKFIENISEKVDLKSIFNETTAGALSEVAEAWVTKEQSRIETMLKTIPGKPKLVTPKLNEFVTAIVATRIEGSGHVQPKEGSLVISMLGGVASATQFQKKLNAFIDSGIAPSPPTRRP